MALFRCGGANLLNNKNVSANASGNNVVKAVTDGYEGFEQVTVEPFATLGSLTRSVTSNGSSSFSVVSNNKSYSTVSLNVNVPVNMDSTRRAIWSGAASSSNMNVSVSYNSTSLYNDGFRYLEFVATNSTWVNPWNGQTITGNSQTARTLVPLGETGRHAVGFVEHITGFSTCFAVMPFIVESGTSILLCPTADMNVSHICPVGTITNIYAVK